MRRTAVATLVALLVSGSACAFPAQEQAASTNATAADAPLTMETIMANPDWIGQAVENPYWSVDGRSIYYSLKRDGSSVEDLYRVPASGGTPVKLDPAAMAKAGGPPLFDRSHQHAAYLLHGDVFVVDVASGRRTQVTETPQHESSLQFSADGRALQYRDGLDWYSYNLSGGVATPVAQLKFADDPQAKKPGQLEQLQLHLFKTLRDEKADKQAMRARDKALDAADPGRASQPFYLGDKAKADYTSLSPDGRWMLVLTIPKSYQAGKHPVVNHYVTDSGYTEPKKARVYVGRNGPAPQSIILLDLKNHQHYALKTDTLPGIKTDPLKALRDKQIAALNKAGEDDQAKALEAPDVRPTSVAGIVWSDDGSEAAVQVRSNDNKDRWITSVDFNKHTLVTQQRLTDKAWISWSFNDVGWLKNSHTLWYLSEQSGYSQLYTQALDGSAKQLTSGKFEISDPTVSPDGKWFYVLSNKQSPVDYDVYRVPVGGGSLDRITHYEGMYSFEGGVPFRLSPDGSKLAVLHSSAYVPPQLAVVDTDGSGARDLTDTLKPAYKAMHWIKPEIVEVPSSHGAGVIYAKVYKTADYDMSVSHPAVFFVHGAGYLQDVTNSSTYYFREQMFNNMLAREGYAVIDMDYRASAGYGRDWRTAIYEKMGHPELEDLLDGKAWLVKNLHVDPKRVGIYGGSYGGFMTEMALLRAPGEFAAGAALRAPSDWTSYNDGYTANILNDPQIDPEAYKISSPIEYAANLQDPLLIEHGLIDDNVMTSDSIRLYQRFIELHKKNFWISLYPMERHAFEHADAWYDEYRRIHNLFTRFVKPVKGNSAGH